MLQLATFNDFGEGTQFEPTVEDGFRSLNQIQQFTGVSYGTAELQFIYELYLARKKYAGKTAIESQLDQVSNDLDGLNVSAAEALFATVAPPATTTATASSTPTTTPSGVPTSASKRSSTAAAPTATTTASSTWPTTSFGVSSLAGGAGAGALAGAAVPEPTIAALITLAAISVYGGTMRRPRPSASAKLLTLG